MKPINKSHLFKKAWSISRTWHIEFSKALKYAWSLSKHYSPISEIEFVKKSTGEITRRLATDIKPDGHTLLFWSLSDNGWRKAICANVLSISSTYLCV